MLRGRRKHNKARKIGIETGIILYEITMRKLKTVSKFGVYIF